MNDYLYLFAAAIAVVSIFVFSKRIILILSRKLKSVELKVDFDDNGRKKRR